MSYGTIKADGILDSNGDTLDITAVTSSEATTAAKGYMSAADKTKLDGIEATDYATSAQGTLADSATQPGDLSTVATTGSYNDLSNLPTSSSPWTAATGGINYASGNVGIGTSSPTSNNGTNLNINDAGSSALHLTTSNSGTSNSDGFHIINSSGIAYLWNRENTDTVFATNNTERLRIDSSGNVGIGTSSPNSYTNYSTLTLNGSIGGAIEFETNGTKVGNVFSSGSLLYVKAAAYKSLVLSSNNIERMRIDIAGNVGIGTTAPAKTLEVKGDVRFYNATDASSAVLDITADSASPNGVNFASTYFGSSGFGPLRFTTSDTERMRIDSSGNVGIGTTSNLLSSSTRTTLSLNNSGSAAVALGVNGTREGHIYADASSMEISATDNPMYFTTGNSERMRIDSSGNVGIGTSSPQRKLQIRQDGAYALKVGGSSGAEFYLELGQPGASASPGINYTGPSASLRFLNNGNDVARFDSSGRLLVGTSSASSNTGVLVVQGYAGVTAGEGTLDLVRGNNVTGAVQGLGSINFGHSQYQGASIDAIAEGAWTEGSSHPAYLSLATTANGASSPTERMRIDSSGRVGINLTPSGSSKLQVNGSMRFAGSGTASDSTNPIIYRVSGQDSLAFASGNSERMRIDSSGNVGIGTSSPSAKLDVSGVIRSTGSTGKYTHLVVDSAGSYIDASHFTQFRTNGASSLVNAMRIDSSGRLLVGTSSTLTDQPQRLQIEGTSFNTGGASLRRNSNDAGGTALRICKSRGTTSGSYSLVSNNDTLGLVQFCGADGTNDESAAEIRCQVDTTPGSNDMPGRLTFSTTANGASSPTERMRIDSSGRVGIGTSSPLSGSKLTVAGGCLAITGQNTAHGANSLRLGQEGSGVAQLRAYGPNTSTSGQFQFTSSTSNGYGAGEVMRISSEGKLYLGPYKSAGQYGTVSQNVPYKIGVSPYGWHHGGDIAEISMGSHNGTGQDDGQIVFKTAQNVHSNATGLQERVRIDDMGRLLVGGTSTAAYAAKLYAYGSDTLIVSEGYSTGYTEGAFKCVSPNNSRGGGIFMFNHGGSSATSQWFAGRPYSVPDRYIIARTTGNGINDQATAQNSNALLILDNNGNLTIDGTLYQSGSDDKLKTNRTQLTSALDKVETLEGFTFNWNEDAINNYGFSADDGALVGMSAQELQLVLPEAVKVISKNAPVSDPTSGEEGEQREYLTIQYERVVPLLVEAIKELSAKNADLTAQLAKIETLEQRLSDAGIA